MTQRIIGRTIIIGLDGMPYGLMHRFANDGTMPNLRALISQGIFRQMASSIPEISSVAWSSVITGANPGAHGIYGFTDIAPGTYRTTFPSLSKLCVKPFWEREGEGRSAIINVPTTFPARAMNGVHIAGFVALDLKRATYPPSLLPTLEALDYRVDVDAQKAHESLGFFLRDMEKTLQARIATYRVLWKQEDWDTFMLVFTGTDRLGHFLWDAYEDPTHPHHQDWVDHFRQIDAVIGEIAQQLGEHDRLIMLSDHGSERLHRDVFINYVLQQAGFLAFEDNDTPGLRTIAAQTKAFALDPGRIYLHAKSRYPRGSVAPADHQAIIDDLTALFASLEVEGHRAIKIVLSKDEIYAGAQINRAPDLVLLGNKGYNLRGNWKAAAPAAEGIFVGKHSYQDAFLLAYGEHAATAVPENPCVTDVLTVIDRLRNQPAKRLDS